MNSKTIIFMDLEGTILDEETGQIVPDTLEEFIELIDRIEKMSSSEVNIHLVSPVRYDVMKKVKDRIDISIKSYNAENKTHIRSIESAACDIDEEDLIQQLDKTIVPLPKNVNQDKKTLGLIEKDEYVDFWYQLLNSRYDIKNLIYIGNGRNDFEAMRYAQSQGGIVICPQNSRTKVKEIADYIGNSHALLGVNEALKMAISNKLQKRQNCRE